MGFKRKNTVAEPAAIPPARPRRRQRANYDMASLPAAPLPCVVTCVIDFEVNDAKSLFIKAHMFLKDAGVDDDVIAAQLTTQIEGEDYVDLSACMKVFMAGTISTLEDLTQCSASGSDVYLDPLSDASS